MVNSWFKSKLTSLFGTKRPKGSLFPKLTLVDLEQRINPAPTVSVSYDNSTGVLLLNSNALANENSSYEAFQSTTVGNERILNFRATPGFATTFNSVSPLVFVNPLSNGSGFVQVNTLNLANFTKIIFQGSEGNDSYILGAMDGNVIGDGTKADFGFEVDVISTGGGFSSGSDSLQVNGVIGLKGAGSFTTDSVNTLIPNLNLDSILFSSNGRINSVGSGGVRLVADGVLSSSIIMNSGSGIDIGSGDVFLRSGSIGSIQLNGDVVSNEGGKVEFKSNVVLQSSTSINTGLGNSSAQIIFSGTVEGVSVSGQNLLLDTSGSITLAGDIGNVNLPLGSINIGSRPTNAIPVAASMQNVFAKSLTSNTQVDFTSNGVINLNYIDGLSVNTTSSSGIITIGSPGIVSSSVNTLNGGGVLLNNAGLLRIYGGLSLDGSFSQIGPGSVTLGNNVGVVVTSIPDFSINTTSDPVSFASAINLNQPNFISTNVTGTLGLGANISFSSTVDGYYPMTFVAGVGNITFSSKIGSNTPVSSILINNVNKFTSNSSIIADSLTIIEANNEVVFNGSQSYSQSSGLTVNTTNISGNVIINQQVSCSGSAQININNAGILNISNSGTISVETGSINLGGSGGGGIYLNASISAISNSGSGNITFKNPVSLFSPLTVTTSNSSVSFLNTLNSGPNGSQTLNLQGLQNQGTFVFSKGVGSLYPLTAINVLSSGGVTFGSTLNLGSITIEDSKNSVIFADNLNLSGNLTSNFVVDAYSVSLLGLNNQIGGTTLFSNTGLITLGNSNSSSFLFTNGITEIGGGGVFAQGSFVTGSSAGLSFASPFTVNGNNVGIVSLDTGSTGIFSSLIDVQANEKIIKNGPGGLRFTSNAGSAFKGSLVINQGNVNFSDDFSSIFNVTISGGSVSGTGKIGVVSGLSGSIFPGDAVGQLSTANLSLNPLMNLGIGLTMVPSQTNDSLAVNGLVSLNNSTLNVSTNFGGQTIRIGDTFTILQNDGSEPVAGIFAGLPQGSNLTSGIYIFSISYSGGSGNDITLRVVSINGAPNPAVEGIRQIFATAADAGGGPLVTVNYPDGHTSSFFAYDPGFTGGVRIAMGDINGDKFTDLVTSVGIGGGPHIKVWDLSTGAAIQMASFFAFESAFTGGLYLGVGYLNSDSYADIIVGAGPGGGPRVTAFAGAQAFAINQNEVITNFFAYSDVFRGGVTVAAADRTGDGFDEIVTGAGFGGGPNVSVFQLVQTTPNQFNPQLIQNFFVFDTTFTGGIFVAGGRFSNGTNSSGQILDDIFVGTGPGTQAQVAVAFGTGGFYYLNPFGNFQGGARVGISSSSGSLDTPGINYLMVAAGPGGGPQVNLYQYAQSPGSINKIDQFFALNPEITLGVFANTTIL